MGEQRRYFLGNTICVQSHIHCRKYISIGKKRKHHNLLHSKREAKTSIRNEGATIIFLYYDGKKIVYIPVVFLETQSAEKQKEIEEMLEKSVAMEQEIKEQPQNMQQIQVPKPADTKKTIDTREGVYML